MKRALITGITGMDGSYMADLLLSKGYEVFGLERVKAENTRGNIAHIVDKISLIPGDLADYASLVAAIEISRPEEVYNFAAQSFVGTSWKVAEYTTNITGVGVLRLINAIKHVNKNIKFAQASTSEMFGKAINDIANEGTDFHPRSPYASAKAFAHTTVRNFRESFGMFACCSICFNHESERRGIQFVTRKITDAVARISQGKQDFILLGNLDPMRDWGYAPEYVEGIWRMLQYKEPTEFVFATGKSHSIREFLKFAFNYVGIVDWEKYIKQDPEFMRPADVDYTRGDSSKAKSLLGWEPKVQLQELVGKMLAHDMQRNIL